MNYQPPIKGQLKKPQQTGRDFVESVVGVKELAQELQGVKNDLIGQVNSKIKEVDNKLESEVNKIVDASKVLERTKTEAIQLIRERAIQGEQGNPGKDT